MVLREKFIAIKAHIRREKNLKINKLSIYFNKLEKIKANLEKIEGDE